MTQDGSHRFLSQVTIYVRALSVAPTQKATNTAKFSARVALKELLSTLELGGVLIQADGLHMTQGFSLVGLPGSRPAPDRKRETKDATSPGPLPAASKGRYPTRRKGSRKRYGRYATWNLQA